MIECLVAARSDQYTFGKRFAWDIHLGQIKTVTKSGTKGRGRVVDFSIPPDCGSQSFSGTVRGGLGERNNAKTMAFEKQLMESRESFTPLTEF